MKFTSIYVPPTRYRVSSFNRPRYVVMSRQAAGEIEHYTAYYESADKTLSRQADVTFLSIEYAFGWCERDEAARSAKAGEAI
jgi:hypothetical protein